MNLKLASVFLLGFYAMGFQAQEKDKKTIEKDKISKKDSLSDKADKGIASYDTLLKDAKSKKGLFTIHQVKDKIYFEIPNELLGKDLLVVNKISSVPAEINNAGINKGINYENKLIRFYKDVQNKKVWAKTFDPKIEAPKKDNIYQSVKDNYGESIIEGFEIKAFGKDSVAVVQVNDVFNGTFGI
ncbi:DUF5118 domain-containing protein [Bergeyella porcorum]|uniref:DUF5118 domain-containing protein n=1 Tax=Bergeyella porcorum TaxID=1735111 RepID=UPI0035E99B51